MSRRLKIGRLVVFSILGLAGLGIAADHVHALQSGGGVVAVRAGEAGDAAAEKGGKERREPRICAYAPCGMPIYCRDQEF